VVDKRVSDRLSSFGTSVMIAGELGIRVELRRKVEVCGWRCVDANSGMILGIIDVGSQ
jgi:hypothetical protein